MTNELYADCTTKEDCTETCSRINRWMCCDLDPKVAMEHIRRGEAGV